MTKIAKAVTPQIKATPQVTALEAYSSEPSLLTSGKALKVLITRPEVKAQQLACLLDQQGIANTSQALFDYQPYANADDISTALKRADMVIFVSVAAVEFTHAIYPLQQGAQQTFFAVGNATKQALHAIGISKVLAPPSQQEHSEGLLNLPELSEVNDKNVVIIRGNGGREHIATSLKQRGAQVSYIESYQRVWRTLAKNIAQQWQVQKINCIVVTSNDILTALLKHLSITASNSESYWQTQCLWLVVSDRIERNAKASGLTRVINSQSASSQILSDTLQALSCS